jgi:hypothetical protein
MILALSTLAWVLLQQPSQPPALLSAALKTLPGVALVESPTAWLEEDLDGDKRSDVAAVVVKTSKAGREFGVLAVHARTPQEIHWIIDFDVDSISGIVKGKARDTVVPLFCVECDSNLWFRWSGEEYEAELFAVGEELEIGSETQADLPLYASPNLAAKPVTTVPHCTTVVVRKVGGTAEKRWYFVETPESQRGWVPDAVTSSDICVG